MSEQLLPLPWRVARHLRDTDIDAPRFTSRSETRQIIGGEMTPSARLAHDYWFRTYDAQNTVDERGRAQAEAQERAVREARSRE